LNPSLSAEPAQTAASRSLRPLQAILWAGLVVGVLDLCLAYGLYRARPTVILQSIASGLLGREAAFRGGMPTAALGALLHFFIATTAAAIYYAASLKLPLLVRRAVPAGLAFGVAVYFFMNYVVIPLSLMRKGPFNLPIFVGGLIGHALLVGLPIALIARRALPNRARP
jgi:uncharacterized membrane protein YagU involved in acid resistance